MSWVTENRLEKDYTVQCATCGIWFVSRKHLNAHMQEVSTAVVQAYGNANLAPHTCMAVETLRKNGWKTKELHDDLCFYNPELTARAQEKKAQEEAEVARQYALAQQAMEDIRRAEEEQRLANAQNIKVVLTELEEEFSWE